MIGSKEHYDLMIAFERDYHHLRLDKEKDKHLWKIGQIYENGNTNELYQAFIKGYAYAKRLYQNESI